VEKMKAVNIKTQSMKVKRDDGTVYKYMMKKPKYFMGASTTDMVLQCKRAGKLWEMDTEDVNMADIDTEVDETEQDCVEQVSSEYDSMYKAMGLHAVEGETPKKGDMSKYVISDSADDLEIPSSMKRPSCSMAELGLPEQQKKKKKMTNYVDDLIQLMTQYNCTNPNELAGKIFASDTSADIDKYRGISRNTQYSQILRAALDEIHLVSEITTVYEELMKLREQKFEKGYMTVEETEELLNRWCNEQGIPVGAFLFDAWTILGQKLPKKNCLYLQGASNAGKSFWIDAMIGWCDSVGNQIESDQFMYQELINKKVAVLNEIHLNPVTVETFKNIAEGRETGINVKNKAQQTLKRLPIMLTSNTLIWTGIPQEKRIVSHLGLVESEVLCGEELHPNPI
jgi:hypothetical protein